MIKPLLFVIGLAVIAIALGAPDDLPKHSGGNKAVLPYFAFWLLSPLKAIGGKYLLVAIGALMVAVSLLMKKSANKRITSC